MMIITHLLKSLLIVVLATGTLFAEWHYTISGDVTDTTGKGIPGALVQIKNSPFSDKTDEFGAFEIRALAVPLKDNRVAVSENMYIHFDRLHLTLSQREQVRIDLFNAKGALLTEVVNGTIEQGVYDIDLHSAGLGAGVRLVRVMRGNSTSVWKYRALGDGSGYAFSNAGYLSTAVAPLGEAKGCVSKYDTLVVSHPQFISASQVTEIMFNDSPVVITMKTNYWINTLVTIPGGTFLMGDQVGHGDSNELPVHQVTVSSFKMSNTEVTQEEYFRVMGVNPSHFEDDSSFKKYPVEQVSWYDAVRYCNARTKKDGNKADTVYRYTGTKTMDDGSVVLQNCTIDLSKKGFRLPTEAEWEYACRAGSTTDFSFGNDTGMLANYAWYRHVGSVNYSTISIARKIPNAFGLHDMYGNVWEWCNDGFSGYGKESVIDPLITENNYDNRMIRGGSIDDTPYVCRSSSRVAMRASGYLDIIGFRVVVTP